MAVLTTALTRLRADFNTRFPGRDKASDGWIGNAAHAAGTSGHNPDETGRGEYEDPDSKDEVRAIDVDVDFREPGVTAQHVVDAILLTPADLARLRYIIYNRRIWSRNTNWQPRAYTGSNPHDKHIHFSGDPATDEHGRPWQSVLGLGRTFMAGLTDAQQTEMYGHLKALAYRFRGYQLLDDTIDNHVNDPEEEMPIVTFLRGLEAQGRTNGEGLTALKATVDRLAATPPGTVVITDEQLERVLRTVIGSVDGQ